MKNQVLLVLYFLLSTELPLPIDAVVTLNGSTEACQGSIVTLQCMVLRGGNTLVDSQWLRNNIPILTNDDSDNYEYAMGSSVFLTEFIITNITMEDNNVEFRCQDPANSDDADSVVLSVTAITEVENIMAVDNCDNIMVDWNMMQTGPCVNSTMYRIILIPSNSDLMYIVETSNNSVRFDNEAIELHTASFTLEFMTFSGAANVASETTNVSMPSAMNKPQITLPMAVRRCVSYLYINWTDTTPCLQVYYTVMLTNTSSGELLHIDTTINNFYNFTELTSDASYTVEVTGRNRAGSNAPPIISITTLESLVPPVVNEIMSRQINESNDDIEITWMVPMIPNPCNTSVISGYVVRVDYHNEDDELNTDNCTVNASVTAVYFSTCFRISPSFGTTYNFSVFAVNERGLNMSSPTISITIDDDEVQIEVIIPICVVIVICIGLCTSSLFIFCCEKNVEGSSCTVNGCLVMLIILSFGLAPLIWFIYDGIKKCRAQDKGTDSSEQSNTCNIVLAICSCGLTTVLWWIYEKARSCKVKDGGDAPDSQNMPLKDTNKPVRSAAEEQSLYSYARTGPINVVMEGGSSARPGDKPRQT